MLTHNVKDWGAVGDGVTDDTAAIQSAIDALIGAAPTGHTLFFPVGQYRISAPVGYTHPTHYSARLRLMGEGPRQTRIVGGGFEDHDALVFGSDGGQFNYLRVESMSFGLVNRALDLHNVYYSEFVDLEFSHTGRKTPSDFAVAVRGRASALLFERCVWLHTRNDSLLLEGGRARFDACQIGEDAGGCWIGGVASFANVHVHNSQDRRDGFETGLNGWGRAAFTVTGHGILKLDGGQFVRYGSGEAVVNFAGEHVSVRGMSVDVQHGATIVRAECAPNRTVSVTDNHVRMWGGGSAVLFEPANGSTPQGVRICGNDFQLDADCTMTLDDELFSAGVQNTVADNIVMTTGNH